MRLAMVLLSTMILVWLTYYIEIGVLKDEAEAKQVYQDFNVWAVGISVLGFVAIGRFTDSYPP